jgi:hypothetical protein
MIFAEMEYEQEYSEFHDELVIFIKAQFPKIEYGLQGDSWIWIFEDDEKVAIDTFSSMKHQIKSSSAEFTLVNKVIEYVSSHYKVVVYDTPELEGHD